MDPKKGRAVSSCVEGLECYLGKHLRARTAVILHVSFVEVVETSGKAEAAADEDVAHDGARLIATRLKEARDRGVLFADGALIARRAVPARRKSGVDARHTGQRPRCSRNGMPERDTCPGELQQIGRGGSRVSVKLEMIRAQRVDRNQHEIRACRSVESSDPTTGLNKKEKECGHHASARPRCRLQSKGVKSSQRRLQIEVFRHDRCECNGICLSRVVHGLQSTIRDGAFFEGEARSIKIDSSLRVFLAGPFAAQARSGNLCRALELRGGSSIG